MMCIHHYIDRKVRRGNGTRVFIHLIVSFMHAALWRRVTEPLDWQDLILETVGKIRVENSAVPQRESHGGIRKGERIRGANENSFTFCESERKRSMRYERSRIIAIGSL